MRDVNLRSFTDPCMNTYIHINMQKTEALKLGTVGNVSKISYMITEYEEMLVSISSRSY